MPPLLLRVQMQGQIALLTGKCRASDCLRSLISALEMTHALVCPSSRHAYASLISALEITHASCIGMPLLRCILSFESSCLLTSHCAVSPGGGPFGFNFPHVHRPLAQPATRAACRAAAPIHMLLKGKALPFVAFGGCMDEPSTQLRVTHNAKYASLFHS